MRILVTGTTGRIGANLAAALRQQGHTVRGLVWPRDPRVRKLERLGLELLSGTLTNGADVSAAVDGMEAVFHLGGAFQGGGPFTAGEYFEINVRGTMLVLDAARAAGVRHTIVASTDAVYEKYVPGGLAEPIREDDTPRRPRGWYSLSKSLAEELCTGYARTFRQPITIMRFSLVAGAGEILDFPQFYLSHLAKTRPELASRYTGEERLVVLRDETGRAYKKHIADVRDIVAGCINALDRESAIGETIQLAGPAPFTWNEVIPYLAKALALPVEDVTVPGPPTYYEFDLTKARRCIDFHPAYTIFRMIDDAVAFRRGGAGPAGGAVIPTN